MTEPAPWPYRDKYGPIPPDHFENEPGPPRPLEESMSAEALARFDAETARMKRVVEAEQARRRKTQPEPVVEITIEITTEPKPS